MSYSTRSLEYSLLISLRHRLGYDPAYLFYFDGQFGWIKAIKDKYAT